MISKNLYFLLAAVFGAITKLQPAYVKAEKNLSNQVSTQELNLTQRARVNYDAYVLGPGDGLYIELLDLPELDAFVAYTSSRNQQRPIEQIHSVLHDSPCG